VRGDKQPVQGPRVEGAEIEPGVVFPGSAELRSSRVANTERHRSSPLRGTDHVCPLPRRREALGENREPREEVKGRGEEVKRRGS
jgi:hypothetical protein